MDKKEGLIIFDTTLRDGEQCPGASMNTKEKLQVATILRSLNVDVIEAGFPIASEGDFNAVNEIAKSIKDVTICGLARAIEKDIDVCARALLPAEQKRIHTFIATSPVHMQYKLNMSEDQVLEQAIFAVKKAKNHVDDVEFSAEDAGRSDIDFLCKIIEATIKAGATTINIPDTVGYTIPFEYGQLIKTLLNKIPNADKAIFSTHCHNDLGLAVANSLSGVLNGARQVECTINGIGERAGNAALEEVVMAVKTRPDVFPVDTKVVTSNIVPASQMVESITGFTVQKNKAIVGANAFAHESGIHQDGILKERTTYEIMLAEHVGWDSNKMVLGKHSGRNAFSSHLESLNIHLDEMQLNEAFLKFKALADDIKTVSNEQIIELTKNIIK